MPTAEIMPYSISETPPIIANGIVSMINANFGINESIIAKHAAILITSGSYTFVSARTPVFSPYVVLAGVDLGP